MSDVERTYDEVRAAAARAAYQQLLPMLQPHTCRLITLGDMAAAITAANDVLTPGEAQLAQRAVVLQGELDRETSAHSRTLMQRDEALRHAESAVETAERALRAADDLAYALAELTGQNIGHREKGNDPWRRALEIVDRIAVANNRPRPKNSAAEYRFERVVP